MRNDKDILKLILNFAKEDSNIRAVIMNGSRVNPNIKKDPFQDFDIIYLVVDVKPFIEDRSFVKYFGEIMILQTPEDMIDPPPVNDGHFTFLMQFTDGYRIDLSFYQIDHLNKILQDSLTKVLLDKDHLIPDIPSPSETSYLPERPTQKMFDDCCNEFWWVNPYVAKALWRKDVIYAKELAETFLRPQLMKMLIWYFGIKTDFKISVGKGGKRLAQYLDDRIYQKLLQTYPDANLENIWNSLFDMNSLFREVGLIIEKDFGFHYSKAEDEKVTAYLKHIKSMPEDATSIY